MRVFRDGNRAVGGRLLFSGEIHLLLMITHDFTWRSRSLHLFLDPSSSIRRMYKETFLFNAFSLITFFDDVDFSSELNGKHDYRVIYYRKLFPCCFRLKNARRGNLAFPVISSKFCLASRSII